jgi:hypothetical protein
MSRIWLSACVLLSCVSARAADVSGFIENSDAIESARRMHSSGPFSVMASSTFQTPAMNNLNSHLNSLDMSSQDSGASGISRHARSANAPDGAASSTADHSHGSFQPGYMLRHSIAANYELSSQLLIGPAFGFSEPFYGRHDGQFQVNDPQLRLTLLDLLHGQVGGNNLHSSMLFSTDVPVSQTSRRRSLRGAFSLTASPRMHFRGTPYSLSVMCSVKTGFYGKPEGGSWMSSRLNSGVQGGYRLSRRVESSLMLHAASQFGPDLPTSDPDAPMRERGTQVFGLMPSVKYQATQAISLTPRLNWYLDQPIRTTTVSVAAMMRLI